jgi:hypothetical protein
MQKLKAERLRYIYCLRNVLFGMWHVGCKNYLGGPSGSGLYMLSGKVGISLCHLQSAVAKNLG